MPRKWIKSSLAPVEDTALLVDCVEGRLSSNGGLALLDAPEDSLSLPPSWQLSTEADAIYDGLPDAARSTQTTRVAPYADAENAGATTTLGHVWPISVLVMHGNTHCAEPVVMQWAEVKANLPSVVELLNSQDLQKFALSTTAKAEWASTPDGTRLPVSSDSHQAALCSKYWSLHPSVSGSDHDSVGRFVFGGTAPQESVDYRGVGVSL